MKNQTSGNVYLTHNYTCGVCSSLADLRIFLTVTDLTVPVRSCILKNLWKFWLTSDSFREEVSSCFQETIGFSPECSKIWQYNSEHTKNHCRNICMRRLQTPPNEPFQRRFLDPNHCHPDLCQKRINGENACSDFQYEDGPYRLNSCIQCDECNSGPVFQKFSGRTRRNTGIKSDILRPDSQQSFVSHYYGI